MLNGYLATFYCTEFHKSDAACSEDSAAFPARDTVPAPFGERSSTFQARPGYLHSHPDGYRKFEHVTGLLPPPTRWRVKYEWPLPAALG